MYQEGWPMGISRREFLKGGLGALGFAALPGGYLFAAPPGWKHNDKPNLVFGVLSDTHLRTGVKCENLGANWPDKYFVAALRYFKDCNMERHGNVIASIQGHHHRGHYSFRNGIHYWTMKAMIAGAHPPHNSYAVVEISPEGTVSVNGFCDCESKVLVKGERCNPL